MKYLTLNESVITNCLSVYLKEIKQHLSVVSTLSNEISCEMPKV